MLLLEYTTTHLLYFQAPFLTGGGFSTFCITVRNGLRYNNARCDLATRFCGSQERGMAKHLTDSNHAALELPPHLTTSNFRSTVEKSLFQFNRTQRGFYFPAPLTLTK